MHAVLPWPWEHFCSTHQEPMTPGWVGERQLSLSARGQNHRQGMDILAQSAFSLNQVYQYRQYIHMDLSLYGERPPTAGGVSSPGTRGKATPYHR